MDDKLYSGKFSRALKTTALATRSGAKHLRYLGEKQFSNNKEQLKQDYHSELGKLVFSGLAQMRGTALKASQLLSMETGLLPEEVRKELARSCYKVPPINRALIRKIFINQFGSTPEEVFKSFEREAFAAASLGQVHKATDADGNSLAVKVQYPGVSTSIESDLKILSFLVNSIGTLTGKLPNKEIVEASLDEMANCLRDEVNYIQEASNTNWFRNNLNIENIRVPRVYEKYSSERVLATEFLSGKHPQEWLEENPPQKERNKIGQLIFDTFFKCIFELKMLHADPHEGNYLIREGGEIALLDFGCVREINEDFTKNMAILLSAFKEKNRKLAYQKYLDLGILAGSVSYNVYLEKLFPVLEVLQDWMVLPFLSEEYDFSQLPGIPVRDHREYIDKAEYLNTISRDQMYFDRTYFGVFHLLKKIGAVVNTHNEHIR